MFLVTTLNASLTQINSNLDDLLVEDSRSVTTDANGMAWIGGKSGYILISARTNISSGGTINYTFEIGSPHLNGFNVKIFFADGTPVSNSTGFAIRLTWLKLLT